HSFDGSLAGCASSSRLNSSGSRLRIRVLDYSNGQRYQQPSPERLFDRKCVEVIVPPTAEPPLAVKIGPHLVFKFGFYHINAEEVIHRQRHGNRTEPRAGKAVPDPAIRGFVASARPPESLADELVLAQRFEGTLETVAQIEHAEGDRKDRNDL